MSQKETVRQLHAYTGFHFFVAMSDWICLSLNRYNSQKNDKQVLIPTVCTYTIYQCPLHKHNISVVYSLDINILSVMYTVWTYTIYQCPIQCRYKHNISVVYSLDINILSVSYTVWNTPFIRVLYNSLNRFIIYKSTMTRNFFFNWI